MSQLGSARRIRALAIGIGIFVSSVASVAMTGESSSAAGAAAVGPPNVVLFFVDDAGWGDVSYQGAEFPTPNIDAIATQGVRFTNAHATAPQCGPSRAGLITGVHQARFGYLDNAGNRGLPAPERVPTYGHQMQALGYTTGIVGKWHAESDPNTSIQLSANEITRNERSRPWRSGFDYTLIHDRGTTHSFPYRPDGQLWMTSRNREPRLTEFAEGASGPTLVDGLPPESFLTDVFTDAAVEFIDRRADAAEPFFLFVSYNAPHTPLLAAQIDLDTVPAGITDNERRVAAAMMIGVDRGVAAVKAKLAAEGMLDNTIIIFTSDNGGPSSPPGARDNGPLRGFKGDMYEGGTRVPLAIQWPGGNITAGGQVINDPVSLVDLLPTSVAAAGGTAHPIGDGVDLLPFMTGQTAVFPRQDLIIQWRSRTSFRIGDDKLVDFNATIPANANNPEELFDLAVDLGETTVVNNPAVQQILQSEIELFTTVERDSITTDPVSVGPLQAPAYYTFDEPGGATDQGFNSVLTPIDVPPSASLAEPGLIGNAIRLAGDEGAGLGGFLDEWKPAEDFTAALWVNLEAAPIVQTRVIDSSSINGAASAMRGWRLLVNNGTSQGARKLQFQLNRGVPGEEINASLLDLPDVLLDAWYFVAIRYDQDGDVAVTLMPASAGDLPASVADRTAAFPAPGPMLYGETAVPRLGAAAGGSSKVPVARFDEVQLYDWSLTDDQLAQVFGAARPAIGPDVDANGVATIFDLIGFLERLGDSDPLADLNRDGTFDADDVGIHLGMLRTFGI